jgi:Flp pilus assembly pilin Flp
MKIKKIRDKKGQSMVEYALGIGCVAAVSVAAMSKLGNITGDLFNGLQSAINYEGGPGAHGVAEPGHIVNPGQTPWNIQ